MDKTALTTLDGDGAVAESFVITIADGFYVADTFTAGNHYQVAGLPKGLSLNAIRQSATELRFDLSGTAIFEPSDLTITLMPSANQTGQTYQGGGVLTLSMNFPKASGDFCEPGGDLNTECIVSSRIDLHSGATISGQGSLILAFGGSLRAVDGEPVKILMGQNFILRSGSALHGNFSELRGEGDLIVENSATITGNIQDSYFNTIRVDTGGLIDATAPGVFPTASFFGDSFLRWQIHPQSPAA